MLASVKRMRARYALLLLGTGLVVAVNGVAWASGGGAEGGGHGLNWADFAFRTLNFVILVAILAKLLMKPAGNFFASRRSEIQRTLAELEQRQKEAEQRHAEYTAKLATLEGETRKIVDELMAEGEVERQKIIEAANRQAEYIRQQAQLAAQQEIKAARESLRDEVAELSVTAAEEILRKKMQREDQDRLVRDFMTRVVEAK